MKISEVHYTGGEPTSNRGLEDLTAGLRSLGLKVKTTSNAQLSRETLARLINSGLKSFNFSVLGLSPNDLLSFQRGKSWSWAEKSIKRQKEIIRAARELGGKVKINSVISSGKDIDRCLGIYDFAKTNNIPIRFLADLNNKDVSLDNILYIVKERIFAKKFKEKVTIGSSNKTSYYRDKDGFEFGVKEIRENKLKTLCADCKDKCLENFYGVRLERIKGAFFVRLCIDRKDGKSLLKLEDFLDSDYLKEIISLTNN